MLASFQSNNADALHAEWTEQFIEALRVESQEYGELWQLLSEQQTAILRREPDLVLALDERIDAQLALIRARRKERESFAAALAATALPPVEPRLVELLPLFREPLRPLLEALASEVNQLLVRTRKRAQQNRALLARSVEVARDVLEKLDPASVMHTHSAHGRVRVKAALRSR